MDMGIVNHPKNSSYLQKITLWQFENKEGVPMMNQEALALFL